MTNADDLTAAWILDELWGVPPALSGTLSDEDNLEYGMALFCAANGDGRITAAEREWILGYLRAAGHSAENLATLQAYEGDTDFESLFVRGIQASAAAKHFCIGDAVRACGADGDLADDEVATIHRMAARIGVPAEAVDEFVEIYRAEQELKSRRLALAFPDGVGV